MKPSVDELLTPGPAPAEALARVRARLELQLPAKPVVRTWRRDILVLCAVVWGLVVLTAAALLAVHATTPALLGSRLVTLVPVLGLTALCGWAAFAPPTRSPRLVALLAAALSALGLVLARHGDAHSAQPEWVCTASHVALGLGPLLVALGLLRNAAPSVTRSLLAGLAVGTVGAGAGELACSRGGLHVLLYHVTAWVLVAVAAALASRFTTPRSYAP